MNPATPLSTRRYRGRILGLGAGAFVVIFAVGAAIAIPNVQDDLTDRLAERLADDGVDGLSISFSGQDGTIECDEPLDDPDAVIERAENLHGVRSISLDRSCTDATGDDAVAPADSQPPATEPEVTTPATTEPPTTEPVDTEPPVTGPQLDALIDIVGGDPLFGELSGLLEAADLLGVDGLGADGPLTVLAPTNAAFDAAFDALGADAFEALTSDTELLRSVLLHHVTDGAVRSTDFEAGPTAMLDGTDVVVDPEGADGITFTSGDSIAGVADPATQLDIEASNGVLHAIDQLLLPEGFSVGDAGGTVTSAALDGGQLTLTGSVGSEAQRETLLDAATEVVDPANVVDELVVDDSVDVADEDLDRLSTVVAAMPPNLVVGAASLLQSELSLSGVAVDADATVALEEVASSTDATLALTPRDTADDATAQALEDELNAFVAENPILFEQSSTTLTDEANAVIEQVAARALSLDGISIEIVGHTDTDGDADNNQLLSEGRAAAVLAALVDAGVDTENLASSGEGETAPIVDTDGVEDKPASRRVEFLVTVAEA